MKEVDLAFNVVEWLESTGWDVYQEVMAPGGYKTADVVAITSDIVWVIECKNVLNFDVMAQARSWHGKANKVSVAVPATRLTPGRIFALEVLRNYNIGCVQQLTIYKEEKYGRITEIKPRDISMAQLPEIDALRAALRPEHKTYAKAGSPHGKTFTPFRETCFKVRDAVKKCPGSTVSQILTMIKTHYQTEATAKTAIYQHIRNGVLEGVETKVERGKILLYPVDEVPSE